MIRLSIIIPFYNVEQYIAQCLDSVYDQNIPEEEYEVICVNDASPDGSREIVKEYQKKHKNLVLVEHEENKKLGSARNTGRSIARGRYIWNVDSDDKIQPNCLKEILEVCEGNQLDVYLFRNWLLKIDELCPPSSVWSSEDVMDGMSFWKKEGIKNRTYIGPVWLMVLRKEYLDQQQIYSPPINMNEDVPYTYKCLLLAQRMIATNQGFYIARMNLESMSAVFKKKVSVEYMYEQMCLSSKALYALYNQIPSDESAIKKVIRDIIQYLFVMNINRIQRIDKELLHEYGRILRKNYGQIKFLFRILSRRQKWQLVKLLIA